MTRVGIAAATAGDTEAPAGEDPGHLSRAGVSCGRIAAPRGIYGAITFYLAHAPEIDTYLAQTEAACAVQASTLNAAARKANPALFQRLEHMRQARETTHR